MQVCKYVFPMCSQSTQHADDAPPPTVPAQFDGPQTHAGPNRFVASPHASHTAAAITSGHPCVSTTPSPPYPHVSCAVCLRPVPHLMSTHTHTSPRVSMAPRCTRAPNDVPRPTANASHTPYSCTHPQPMSYWLAPTPRSPYAHATYHLHTTSMRRCERTCCLGAWTMRHGSVQLWAHAH